MTEYNLDFIGRTLLDMQSEVRGLRGDMRGVKDELAQLRDEHVVNTAWLMRERAEPIAGAHLQSQIQRLNERLGAMERRVTDVETRLPAAE
jgi:hypothetical protein